MKKLNHIFYNSAIFIYVIFLRHIRFIKILLLIIFIQSFFWGCGYETKADKFKLLPESSYSNYLMNKVSGATPETHYYGDTGIPNDYNTHLLNKGKDAYALESQPTSFSWADRGAVTVAKNQGQCGSCWAFAATGAFESKIIINFGIIYNLSEQQQVSCNNISEHGCAGGNLTSIIYWEDAGWNHGPMLENCTGYCACDEPCSNFSGTCYEMGYRTTGFYTVNTNNINDIKSSLYNNGPAYFGFDVYEDFEVFWGYGEYQAVYTNTDTSAIYLGGHAVLIIGWNDDKGAWLCKNSWGAFSGPNGNGTFWMAYSGHIHNLNLRMANDIMKPDLKTYSTPCQIPGMNINCCN